MKYKGKETNDYSSDLDTYSDNTSECESDNCKKQISNSTYSTNQVDSTCSSYPITVFTKRKEKINDKFIQKDLLNKICEIAFSPTRDISNNKAKEGISLLNAYTQEELADKLVIQVKQDEYKKFLVVDDISEVYRLLGIHKCINGQNPLRLIIDIDTSKEKWKLKIYHFLYTLTLLVDYQELKEFTKLVYKLTREKYRKFIDRELPEQNFNLCLIEAKYGCLLKELQNREVFPNIKTIIKNKDADIIVSIIESISKSENNDALLSKTIKVYSSVVKAEKISDIVNADILDYEMAKHLENSFKKNLNEIYALRAFQKLCDAGINNETAVEDVWNWAESLSECEVFQKFKIFLTENSFALKPPRCKSSLLHG
ncbi:2704_t:CDS:2, partial [Cetraspora pellucida]